MGQPLDADEKVTWVSCTDASVVFPVLIEGDE